MAKNASSNSKKKKKTGALAAAASRKLAGIGQPARTMTPEHLAHLMLHAEEDGRAKRVTLEDGTWAWMLEDDSGKPQILKPTDEMLEALERFDREGHPAH